MYNAHPYFSLKNLSKKSVHYTWKNTVVSAEECLSLTQNSMLISCSTCSVILNVTATQHTCSLKGIYYPHWLVQRSHHCSRMSIAVHPPWLPGYINVVQTILVDNGRIFLDRLHSCVCVCVCVCVCEIFIIIILWGSVTSENRFLRWCKKRISKGTHGRNLNEEARLTGLRGNNMPSGM